MKSKQYKDHIFNIDTGELVAPAPPTPPQRTMTPEEKKELLKFMLAPVSGISVSRRWLEENCLNPSKKCKRFRMVHYSEGEYQAVECMYGPKERCKKSEETI